MVLSLRYDRRAAGVVASWALGDCEVMPELDGQSASPLDGYDLTVKTLGPCRRDSPLAALLYSRRSSHHWVDASDRVLLDDTAAMALARGVAVEDLPGFEAGGPRRKI